MKRLIDFHCHVDLYPDYQNVITSCEEEEIRTLAVTTTPRAWPRNRELTMGTHYVRAALGLHPQLIGNDVDSELALWEQYLPQTKYIGEVGIDGGSRFSDTLKQQVRVFNYILSKCSEVGGKILTVHSVHSSGLVLDAIKSYLPLDRGIVVLHWFTGNLKEAQQAIELGCYFSINTRMMQTKSGDALIKLLPLERILTETDGPFVKINHKPAHPRDVINVVNSLAGRFKITPEEISKKIFSNLKSLLNDYQEK